MCGVITGLRGKGCMYASGPSETKETALLLIPPHPWILSKSNFYWKWYMPAVGILYYDSEQFQPQLTQHHPSWRVIWEWEESVLVFFPTCMPSFYLWLNSSALSLSCLKGPWSNRSQQSPIQAKWSIFNNSCRITPTSTCLCNLTPQLF